MGLNATEAMGGHGDSVAPSEQLDPNLSSKTRIFIGGLGVSVTSNDLETTFSPLGRVLGVEIVRTGGRSFAYMDFEPFSDKHLNKLFSSYNGCMWKGGRLKLEKAKEHYLVRLQREWAMDTSPSSVGDVACLTKMTTEADINKASKSSGKGMPMISEASGLRIFFPQSKKDTRNERCSSRKNAEMAVAQDTLKSKGENAKGWEATLEEIKFEKKMTIHCKNVNAIPTNIDAKGEPDTINLVDRKRLRADDAAFSSIQDKDEGGNSNMETGSEIKSSVDYKMHDGGGVLRVQDSGTSWVQKASWKDLVGETGQASFSLSSVCGGVTPGCFGDSKDSKTHAAVDSKHSVDKVKRKGLVMNDKNQEHVKGLQGSSDEGSHLFLKSQVVQNTCSDHQEKKSEPSAEMQIIGDRIEGQGSKENSEEMQRQAKESNIQLHRNLSSYRQDTSSAGVCTFMRSVDAEDEWLKSKAAVRSHAKAYRKIVKSSKILGTAPMGRF